METITLDQDIMVFCLPAKSFPDGIADSHHKLHALVPFSAERRYFGLSRPEEGRIEYKAAAEPLDDGELEGHGLIPISIKKGEYISLLVKNYMADIHSIQNAFQTLLSHPGIDPQGYCVEWYLNDQDVQCMIRLGS